MSVHGRLDYLLGVASALEQRGRSDELVEEIADALATAGEYVTLVNVLPTQQVVDFNWAAHQAGRRLGVRVRVEVRMARSDADGRAEARVTRLQALG